MMISLMTIILGGIILGVQSATNGKLSASIGALETALLNFVVGAILLGFWLLLTWDGRLLRIVTVPKWQLFGVVFGTGYLVLMILAVPQIGVVASNIVAIAGQLIASFLIDNFGIFGSTVIPYGWQRFGATLLLIAALVFLYRDQNKQAGPQDHSLGQLFCYLLALLAGSFLSFEGTMYSELGKTIGTFESSFYNFFAGSFLLFLLVLFFGKGSFSGIRTNSSWYLLGGLYGVIYLTSLVFGIPTLGVGIAMIGIVVGQVVISMLIEAFGWFGSPKQPITGARIVALVLMFGALVFIY
ncbi:hypothetical protein IV38_GL001558 [Lactobacillus selangorensis]|uniref:Integral membrane protein n=1 Tax=Lactobacillus selangorensis TaxID=81857 RepID=A0A0R2FSL6_9LACO|nr:DMT family transporter [Lactobacillus selangorensis]KRN28108.1 hypothetical protein IV38_GL001558 [Lactobacillus selangorensis]KRN31015.1 hypothetical protein IV40_GL001657 [Lactobacillus selangorensis]